MGVAGQVGRDNKGAETAVEEGDGLAWHGKATAKDDKIQGWGGVDLFATICA